MNDLNVRIGLIASLAERCPQLGRTALMKYCYFLQTLRRVPLGYRFSLYSYGPFDSGVLADLDAAEATGSVKIDIVYYPGGYGYRIESGQRAEISKQRAANFLHEYQSDIDWVVQEFGALNASELELASTVLYCDREAHQKHGTLTRDQLARRVHDVKPHFTLEQVRSGADDLHGRGLLESISGGVRGASGA